MNKQLWPKWYRPPGSYQPFPGEVVRLTARSFGVEPEQLLGRERDTWMIDARSVVVAILRRRGMSFPAIARVLRRDHTSIMHLHERADIYRKRNPLVGNTIFKLAGF